AASADDLFGFRVHPQRRTHRLRHRADRSIPTRGILCGSYPHGRQACRLTSPAADQVRAGNQPQDRKGARHRSAADAPRSRRRGDRVSSRREFITLLGGAAAWPLAARAQQPRKVWRVGVLQPGAPPEPLLEAVRDGVRDLGYMEGRDIVLEVRWAEGKHDRLAGLAAELVGLKVDVIYAFTTPPALAARSATTTIPIVFSGVGDPVGS